MAPKPYRIGQPPRVILAGLRISAQHPQGVSELASACRGPNEPGRAVVRLFCQATSASMENHPTRSSGEPSLVL